MTVYAEVHFRDGTKRVEPIITGGQTSHYRLSQTVASEFASVNGGVERVTIFEDNWKEASKTVCPKDNGRALAFIDSSGSGRILLPGWSDSEYFQLAKTKGWWALIEVPSPPAELEGSIVD